MGQPLKPGAEDASHLRDVLSRHALRELTSGQALLLGVTPEIARISWEPPPRLLAVDGRVLAFGLREAAGNSPHIGPPA